MANVTGKYESVLIVSLKNGEEAVATTVEKFKTLIEQNATLESVDEWGKRRLACLLYTSCRPLGWLPGSRGRAWDSGYKGPHSKLAHPPR